MFTLPGLEANFTYSTQLGNTNWTTKELSITPQPSGWGFGTLTDGPCQSVLASLESLVGRTLNVRLTLNPPR